MSIKIKYKDLGKKQIGDVSVSCKFSKLDKAFLSVYKKTIRCNILLQGPVFITLDDAEAFFKAGLKLVDQQRGAQ